MKLQKTKKIQDPDPARSQLKKKDPDPVPAGS